MAGRRLLVRVTAVDGDVVALEAGLTEGPYAFGRLRWLEGRNAGLTQIVLASDAEGVTLADAPPFAVAAGTLAELTQGCDKRLESCAARFGNRSEEHTSELQSLMRNSYAVFCLNKKQIQQC